jgi:1-acyl-sn-glycerol-3-phosphate acyltransferase
MMAAQVIRIDRRTATVEPAGEARPACKATTAAGRPCRNPARPNGFCAVHKPPEPPAKLGPISGDVVSRALDFLARRVTGRYQVDEFGFDRELTEKVIAPLVRPLHRRYFRVNWVGLGNVPLQGPALLVGNHSGTLPMDALILKFGLLDEHPAHRHLHLLAADMALKLPFVGPLTRKMGNTLACPPDALRLLGSGELVGVFPEGFKGVGKGYRERYRLQRFGRGGFAELALRTGVPIVPVAIVGAEEIWPMVYDARFLARLLGLPYFPITPFFPWLGPLGAVPLPSKWVIELGEPIRMDGFGADAWQDASVVYELTDVVRDTIQQMLYRDLMRRTSTFF